MRCVKIIPGGMRTNYPDVVFGIQTDDLTNRVSEKTRDRKSK